MLQVRHRASRVPRMVFLCLPGVFDPARSGQPSPWRSEQCGLPRVRSASAPEKRPIAGLHTLPAPSPVNAAVIPVPGSLHDSGPAWVANPSLSKTSTLSHRAGLSRHTLIGIGGGLTTSPLPHHRTDGSRLRRCGRFSIRTQAQALARRSPRPPHARSGTRSGTRLVMRLDDRSGLQPALVGLRCPRLTSAGWSGRRPPPSGRGQDSPQLSRGQLADRQGIDAGWIKHSPRVEGGRHGRVPARPDGTTPPIRFVSLVSLLLHERE